MSMLTALVVLMVLKTILTLKGLLILFITVEGTKVLVLPSAVFLSMFYIPRVLVLLETIFTRILGCHLDLGFSLSDLYTSNDWSISFINFRKF